MRGFKKGSYNLENTTLCSKNQESPKKPKGPTILRLSIKYSFLLSKIAKEIRNRERLLEDRLKIDEELKNAEIDLNTAIKLHAATISDFEKEMRRLENKEENLKVRPFY